MPESPPRGTAGVTRTIGASADAVWDLMATPGNLELCHPFCDRNPVTRWPGVGSRDTIHYRSGWVYERYFTHWIDGVGYSLEIGASGEPTSWVAWRITPTDADACALRIDIVPRSIAGVPAVLQRPIGFAYVRPLLRRYLSAVTQGVDWYVTHREAVRPNQFGRHPWFSERRVAG